MKIDQQTMPGRRDFLRGTAATAAGIGALMALAQSEAQARDDDHDKLTKGDIQILLAAEIAEALAVTTYTNSINTAPFFTRLAAGRATKTT